MSQNPSPLSRFEQLMQGVVEGSFGRIFRTRLQPVEIRRKLERAIEENLLLSNDRSIAANVYIISISPADLARFQPIMSTLLFEMQNAIIDYARRNNYVLTTRPAITFKAETRLVTGEIRINTQLLDNARFNEYLAANAQGSGSTTSQASGATPDETQMIKPEGFSPMVLPGMPPAPPMPMTYAALVMRTPQGPGQTYPINREIIHIGRHTGNDIVINDRRVSRYHAEIRFERGQFVIYDLGSLNGVSINGVPSRQTILRNGDVVGFGNFSFVFERR
jgi:hypothetical protein